MTTPAQYVPDEFQNVIKLPTGPDQGTVTQLNDEIARYTAEITALQKQITAATPVHNGSARKIQRQTAHRMGVPPKGNAAALASLKAQLAGVQARQKRAQKQLYEITGQFDQFLEGEDRDAFLAVKSLFAQFGLGSLAGKIYDYVKEGYGADTISLLLQDTKEYRARFAANEARAKAGLAVLSPAEYLSAESSYRQILESSGLPKGFYDNPADFQRWIAGDVSPTEIKSRVDMALEAVNQTDPTYRGALYQMYGIGESGLAAYFLDRKQAEPILKKQAAAGAIGAAALRRGFALNTLDLEGYASLGITGQDAEAAYGRIADSFEGMLGLAGRYGTSWTQREAEQEVFTPGSGQLNAENAFEKGKRLRSQERAQFAGGRASSSQGLAAGYRQT
ncbi:hypothetical protein [Streptomyces sp. t39]|uniref:hypothetical protein n=1 Tax=Streptomyces sp. t39 TaxID=1828156 RepID=UPI0011CE9682|nr:hypothetical protein [Streptomyces sp. t39]TXS35067.1 hypothetical protein EAO77_37870 [Streptomyces sp. t39]